MNIDETNNTETSWYVIHTKPRQEARALLNLEKQGYTCFLPIMPVEKLLRGKLLVTEEPLFSRYLFIHLDSSRYGQNWGLIRSTYGVSSLVTFGNNPAKVDETFILQLQAVQQAKNQTPTQYFNAGERVQINEGPFKGLEAIYQMTDGTHRAMILIELLGKMTKLKIAPENLRKIA